MVEFNLIDFIGKSARSINIMLKTRKRCYATVSLGALTAQMCERHAHQENHTLIGGKFPAGASESLTWRAEEDGTVYIMQA